MIKFYTMTIHSKPLHKFKKNYCVRFYGTEFNCKQSKLILIGVFV